MIHRLISQGGGFILCSCGSLLNNANAGLHLQEKSTNYDASSGGGELVSTHWKGNIIITFSEAKPEGKPNE
jgi:hypothetical protein